MTSSNWFSLKQYTYIAKFYRNLSRIDITYMLAKIYFIKYQNQSKSKKKIYKKNKNKIKQNKIEQNKINKILIY